MQWIPNFLLIVQSLGLVMSREFCGDFSPKYISVFPIFNAYLRTWNDVDRQDIF